MRIKTIESYQRDLIVQMKRKKNANAWDRNSKEAHKKSTADQVVTESISFIRKFYFLFFL